MFVSYVLLVIPRRILLKVRILSSFLSLPRQVQWDSLLDRLGGREWEVWEVEEEGGKVVELVARCTSRSCVV